MLPTHPYQQLTPRHCHVWIIYNDDGDRDYHLNRIIVKMMTIIYSRISHIHVYPHIFDG